MASLCHQERCPPVLRCLGEVVLPNGGVMGAAIRLHSIREDEREIRSSLGLNGLKISAIVKQAVSTSSIRIPPLCVGNPSKCANGKSSPEHLKSDGRLWHKWYRTHYRMWVKSVWGRFPTGCFEEEPKVGRGRKHIKKSGEEKGGKKLWSHVDIHRITEWLELEVTSGDHLDQHNC